MFDRRRTGLLAEGRPSDGLDPLLDAFLVAGEAESRQLLAGLLSEVAEPVVKGVVRRKLGLWAGVTSARRQDAAELRSEILVQLVERLERLRAGRGGVAIGDFRSYVAVVAAHACSEHLRRRYPQRHSLRGRVRYLLQHHAAFALWEGADGDWLCGLASWRGRTASVQPPARVAERFERRSGDPEGGSLAEIVERVFGWAGRPLRLNDLIEIVADLSGLEDRPFVESLPAGDDDPLGRAADPRADALAELERIAYLRRLWDEIRQLPPRQSTALLLNLRDDQGRGVIALLPLTGVASMRQIADTLGMPAEKFAELWNRLPLDDATLAGLLGVTRQQVINLRKSARERLSRRMAGLR